MPAVWRPSFLALAGISSCFFHASRHSLVERTGCPPCGCCTRGFLLTLGLWGFPGEPCPGTLGGCCQPTPQQATGLTSSCRSCSCSYLHPLLWGTGWDSWALNMRVTRPGIPFLPLMTHWSQSGFWCHIWHLPSGGYLHLATQGESHLTPPFVLVTRLTVVGAALPVSYKVTWSVLWWWYFPLCSTTLVLFVVLITIFVLCGGFFDMLNWLGSASVEFMKLTLIDIFVFCC